MAEQNNVVVIDSLERRKEDKCLIIKGWAVDTIGKKSVKVGIVNNSEIEKIKFNRIYRYDVNPIFQVPVDQNCGFTIIVSLKSFSKTVTLVFGTGKDAKKIPLRIWLPYFHPMEKNNPIQPYVEKFQRGYNYLKIHGLKNTIKRIRGEVAESSQYQIWIEQNETETPEEYRTRADALKKRPKISIAMPVYNVDDKWLSACIDSVMNQYYDNWELCLADDHSSKPTVRPLLEKYQKSDPRIKVVFREKNGHISEATNSAIAIATGEYISFLDNDDTLAPNALLEMAEVINNHPDADLIYSDEDKIDDKDSRRDPHFKSDWAPDSLMSNNYICHLSVYRKSLVDEVGGLRKGYEGSQDHDLVLRVTEKTSAEHIYHIPKILYHWRMLESSTAVNPGSKGYANEAGKKAVTDAIHRRGLKGKAIDGFGPGVYTLRYEIMKPHFVSIIIPTRDGSDDLKRCVDSIISKTTYSDYEILIADNGSIEQATFDLFDEYKKSYSEKFRVIRIDIPFNYARINNLAVKEARGDMLLFLNNDTEVINPDWMTRMLEYAQLDHIGAVGAKLYYPDNTIQHAGIVMGMGGVAGHIYLFEPRTSPGYFGKAMMATNYSALTAACLMVEKSEFESVGGFTEELAVAFNDVDFCLKLFEKGLYNVCVAEAELYHLESKSRGAEDTPEKQKRFTNEIKIAQDKWLKYILNDPLYNPNLSKKKHDCSLKID